MKKITITPLIQNNLQIFRKEYHKKIAKKQNIFLKNNDIDLTKSDAEIQKFIKQRAKRLENGYLFVKFIFFILSLFLIFQIGLVFFSSRL